MAEENKSKNAENDIIEGAKPEDTVAETAKPDADAKGLEASDDKQVNEPVAKITEDKSGESKPDEKPPSGDQPAGKTAGDAKANTPAAKPTGDKKPAAKKKEKPPKLEDKPFNEFMEQHYLPSLKEAMADEGINDLNLEFAKRKLEVMGQSGDDDYWQVKGDWEEPGEGQRQFNIAFIDEDISGQKVFTLTSNGAKPSTIEQFMGDERRITLDLMVLYTLQRLNGQKWLTRN
ncbi:MAG: DUF2996 domain-containing protein [Leptolyngbya foveolarum]|uniref:DUF2996 domain-containing protein n=1 Tax=Leptolyngbya foveolarum TaxID=47253 RepID=A0A2W4UG08_9CYAN|nr:MAG: DUF2996 domain-containing protein [Leptolyngbya foveolarum]